VAIGDDVGDVDESAGKIEKVTLAFQPLGRFSAANFL
jgi:hypothetical protein